MLASLIIAAATGVAAAAATAPVPVPQEQSPAPSSAPRRESPAPVAAPRQESPAPVAEKPGAWKLGTFEVGALAGYGNGTVFDRERTSTSMGQVLVRFALHFGATGGGPMRGNFAIVAEGVGTSIDQDPGATGGGLNLLIRYTWAAGRWRPMLFGGAGVLYTDEQVPPGETKRNFTPQAGVGLQYLITDQIAVGGEYRFHHISNKGKTESNPGINTQLVLFGVSWFY